MDLSPNALAVLERRYLNRNEKGEITENVEEMFMRVARAIAGIDRTYGADDHEVALLQERFFHMMTSLFFIPNSPTLMNAGLPLGQLSACFVLPIPDSMEGIFESVKNTALIHKSGGGTGFSFSRLRPKGSVVRSTGGVASGPVSFMKVFNAATEAVKQGGKRRGANMGILRVDHPDILEFIKCKEDKAELTNFNLSVGITEGFMDAVEKGEKFLLIDPVTKKTVDALDAREVFHLIVEKAWESGEPGIVFLDRINEKSSVAHIGEIESTNPCGEQPLLPYESCNLGSINLARMVKDTGKEVDYDKLRYTVYLAVHFLDNVIDANNYPLPEIEAQTKETRKIGLGVMGFADLLIKLGIPYNSEEAVEVAEKVMEFIDCESKKASMDLGRTRGTFPGYKGSRWEKENMPLRNATTTTIAPTGTISMIAGCSSGIEPLFAVAYTKVCMDNDRLAEVHPVFADLAKERGFSSDRLMEKVIKQGNVQGIKEIPEDVRKIFVTTQEITPYWHVRIQAAFQKYTDNGVSKTINFPQYAESKDIEESFLLAYKLGCKGITVYRDGSREGQVLNTGSSNQEEKSAGVKQPIASGHISPRKRPEITQGMTEKAIAGCGNLYITVNYDSSGVCEVFTNLGKGGGCPSQTEATSRLVSLALRSGISTDAVIEQLKGIRCPSTLSKKSKGANVRVLSCPDAIARTLEKVMNIAVNDNNGHDMDDIAEEIEKMYVKKENDKKNACPECGGKLEYEGGCVLCRSCGYSKCG
ncbi:MAG: vitamin B12-dependent ribonucleotide reductase [Bacillota bacterium]